MKRNQRNGWFYLVFALFLLHGGLAYGQWTESGGNITTSDNVGIGTTNPSAQLTIKSGTSADLEFGSNGETSTYLQAYNRTSSVYSDIIFYTMPTPTMTLKAGGNVGIGTANPARGLLQVNKTGTAISIYDGSASTAIDFNYDPTAGSDQSIDFLTTGTSRFANGNVNGKVALRIGATDRLLIDSSGNVGIGTTSPTSKLHVAGDATIDGNIAAKYQDVAEWVRAGAIVEPGTVVVIDPAKDDQVLPASQAYDTRVAGVVSARPGVILGEPGQDKVKVAHGGRVKVKVDARFGPISTGDLLVSSGTTGYAMRSAPVEVNGISLHRPGTIVGKALEPLKEGQGEILVLLTLQ